MQNNKAFIFIGRSGCGKGTQVELFKQKISELSGGKKILHVETGTLFRKLLQTESYIQKLTKEIVETGGLMPEVMAVAMWSRYLLDNFTGEEDLLFDGCPRKVQEAKYLDSALKFFKISKPVVIYMNVSRDWATKRLTARGRKDDTVDGINSRMNWFDTDVLPVIEAYKNDPDYNLIDVNGEQSIEDVQKEILAKLGLNL
jgi:adenylate kinase